jgi:hypothetical protein
MGKLSGLSAVRCTLPGALALVVLVMVSLAAHAPAGHAQTPPPAIAIAAQPVYRGCNSIVVRAPVGTPWSAIVTRFSDPSAVLVLWRFDNPSQRYQGIYFKDANAPLDGPPSAIVTAFAVWACLSANGRVA